MLPQVLPGLPHKARHQVEVAVASQLYVLQQLLRIIAPKLASRRTRRASESTTAQRGCSMIRRLSGRSTSGTRKLYRFLSGLWRCTRSLTQRLDQSVFLIQNRPTDMLSEGLGLFLLF
jgi:hypothetical protein